MSMRKIMNIYYKLDKEKNVVPCTLEEWIKVFEKNRTVKLTKLEDGGIISTVFLGIDHSFGNGDPLVFESMVFSKEGEELDQIRYSTYKEAEEGHIRLVNEYKTHEK